MRVPVWAFDLACSYWTTVGAEEGFPRTFERIWGFFSVQWLHGLTVASAMAWLAERGIVQTAVPDRELRGLLTVGRGHALVFVDANDPPDEQRYTLAHELAHYLRDVWRPRQRVERLLGKAAAAVCDGERAASQDERLAAALDGITLVSHLHLMPRDADGDYATPAIADAEEAADVLALELLAPAAHLANAGADAWSSSELVERLMCDYGLPRREAVRYVERLRPAPARVDGWLQALRASV